MYFSHVMFSIKVIKIYAEILEIIYIFPSLYKFSIKKIGRIWNVQEG